MIRVEVDEALEKITKQLDGVWYKAPTVLKDAANATGRYAMKQMVKSSEKRYDYKDDATRLATHLRRKSASYANPFSVMTVKGSMSALTKFHVSPMTLAHGRSRPGSYAAHVMKGQADKALGGNDKMSKAFVVRFKKSGHVALVQREYGETYKNPEERKSKHLDPTKIVEKSTSSPVHMASKIYDLEQDAIGAKLQHYTQMYIDKFMKARAAL